jgi:hypothetical protein
MCLIDLVSLIEIKKISIDWMPNEVKDSGKSSEFPDHDNFFNCQFMMHSVAGKDINKSTFLFVWVFLGHINTV